MHDEKLTVPTLKTLNSTVHLNLIVLTTVDLPISERDKVVKLPQQLNESHKITKVAAILYYYVNMKYVFSTVTSSRVR